MQARFHIPSLDGLRAVAVLTVFLGHSQVMPGLWPGHVGVTIFFFLSGFLITTLLRRELQSHTVVSLKGFYLRRLLRITPPALFSILLCVIVGYFGWIESTMNGWGILAEIFNYTNYYITYVNGHYGLPPESSMLWSLAVEEHFYLVFPALFIALTAKGWSLRRVGWLLIFLAALAPFWRLYLHFNGGSFYRLYTSTDTRYDGLILGAAMALLWNPALGDRAPLNFSQDWIVKIIAPTALAVFCVLSVFPDGHRITYVDSILYACLMPLFWVFITAPTGWMGRVLNHRVAVHIGYLSFSLYLVHRLVLQLASQLIKSPVLSDLVALVLSLLLAQLMYMIIEKPCAKLRKSLESVSHSIDPVPSGSEPVVNGNIR